MDFIPASDEPEDGMRVGVVRVRQAPLHDDGLQGLKMCPDGFLSDEDGVEEESAEVIQGGDKVPLHTGSRGPEMNRGVMLDEFSSVPSQNFSIMNSFGSIFEIEVVFLGSINDGG